MGAALSADAMSVTICNMLAHANISRARAMLMPLFFGLFQSLMPVVGYYAGSLARAFIESYAGIITLLILGVIGGKMIWDGVHDMAEEKGTENDAVLAQTHKGVGFITLILQAIATSIDAFAVGVSLVASAEPIFIDASIIGLCTFILCSAMVAVGRRFGTVLGARAQVVGGIVLVCIGLKAMFF